jgi:adhesin/invasin
VSFTIPATGASGAFAGGGNTFAATTSATGVATSPLITADATVGVYTATATVSGVATPANYTLTNTVGAGATVTIVGGTPQSTTVLTAFAQPLQVVVRTAGGNPITGVNVTFTLPGSAASATFPGNVRTFAIATDASGLAGSSVLTATKTAGTFAPTARAAGIAGNQSFSLTNMAAAPAAVVSNGVGAQSATVNTAFAKAPSVRVTDINGNRVPNVPVTFTSPAAGASGIFAANGTSVVVNTDATGIATALVVTANSTLGTWNVTAAVAGIPTPVTFRMTNVLGTGATVIAAGGTPQSTPKGTAFAQPLQAIVKDSLGNPVTGANVTFTLPTGAASGRFPGNVRVVAAPTNAGGIATSPTVTATATAGSYAATATVAGIATPANFALTNQ